MAERSGRTEGACMNTGGVGCQGMNDTSCVVQHIFSVALDPVSGALSSNRFPLSMARSRPAPSPTTNGQPDTALGDRLRRLVLGVPSDRPLPTTRELGKRFGIANTTVFR